MASSRCWSFWRQHFRGFCGKCFPADSRHSRGTNCAPFSSRHISLLIWSRIYSLCFQPAGNSKNLGSILYIDTLMMFCPYTAQSLGITWARCIPLNLRSDTTESNTSASYLYLLLSIGRDGQLNTSIYDKRDNFNFHITNFPFLSSNIPASPAYGVFISQLIRYVRACSSYGWFILGATWLSNKLL